MLCGMQDVFFGLSDSPAAMGHPDKITPDVIEWILSDEGVVRRWEGFCARLGLDTYKARIDGDYEPRSESNWSNGFETT